MAEVFQKIVNLCKARGFFQYISNVDQISFGPVGCLLRENLRSEWLRSNITNRDMNVFLTTSNTIGECYDFVKDIYQERLPFGLAQIHPVTDVVQPRKQDETNEMNTYFFSKDQLKLQTFTFVSPLVSAQYFYRLQRQRRIWWRKISASPGRYSLNDIQIGANGEQSVEIISTYPWGSHVMETIFLLPDGVESLTKEQLQGKDNRKRVQAHCVVNTVYLSAMVINTICDAFDEAPFQGSKRLLFRFHRKIAPYKISFAITSTNASNNQDLNDLALLLCKQLRDNHISVLLLPTALHSNLESQWCQYDQMGIPYTVVLNENTLKNGIAHLRSRDTTLKEQVHISDLPDYVEKLFKNY